MLSHRSRAALFFVLSTSTLAGGAVAGAASTTTLHATMSAKNEVGDKGPANAKGTFSATIKGGRLCYAMSFSGLTQPIAAHIHKGTSTQNGNIKLDLLPKFKHSKASGCLAIKASLVRAIKKNPKGYYVNVHTQKFQLGAIRGQLSIG